MDWLMRQWTRLRDWEKRNRYKKADPLGEERKKWGTGGGPF